MTAGASDFRPESYVRPVYGQVVDALALRDSALERVRECTAVVSDVDRQLHAARARLASLEKRARDAEADLAQACARLEGFNAGWLKAVEACASERVTCADEGGGES